MFLKVNLRRARLVYTLAMVLAISWGEATSSLAQSLTVLVTGGYRGRAQGCNCPSGSEGGLARRASSISEHFPGQFLFSVDAGGFLDLDPGVGKNYSLCSLKGLQKLGLQTAAVTTRDLFFGLPFLRQLADSIKLDLVCANLIAADTGKPLFPAWVVKECNGWRIAIGGLAQHEPGRRFPGLGQWETVPVDSVIAVFIANEPPACDLTILLTDLNERSLRELIPQFPGLEAVITSSRQVYTPSPFQVGRTVVIHPEPSGGAVDGFTIDKGQDQVDLNHVFAYPLTRDTPSDSNFMSWLEGCLNGLPEVK
ncbi:MAG: hypothetical protein V2A61_08135 [Calditrichota bacterium]